MFVEAEVIELLTEGEYRSFLELAGATYSVVTTKRLRPTDQKREQIAAEGGLLISSLRQLDALREVCVSEVMVDTERSEVVPDEALLDEEQDDEGPVLPEVDGLPAEIPEGPEPPRLAPGLQRRHGIGPDQTGWMKLELTEGGSRADLKVLSFGGDASLSEADVRRALVEDYGIQSGIEESVLRSLVRQAAASPTRVIRGAFPIARATRPSVERLGHVEYTCLQDIAGADFLPHAALGEAWKDRSLDQAGDTALEARIVASGEELARFIPTVDPELPQSIYGSDMPEAAAELVLRAGDNVALAGGTYTSDIYGYVHLSEGEISVLSPVWVSDDRMKGEFVLLPACGPRPELTWEALAQVLEQHSVRFGVQEHAVDMLQNTSRIEAPLQVTVAEGRLPEVLEPQRLDWGTAAAAAMQPDEEIDVETRHRAALAKEGQLLVELHPPLAGGFGIDVAGRRVPGLPADEQALEAGDNVEMTWDEETGVRCFRAAADGVVRIRDGVLLVRPLAVWVGDLEGQSRTFGPDHDVLITGGVGTGSVVRADGTVSIAGAVRSGASVHAQGDVLIEGGIVGQGTRVVALGAVQALFVHSGSVVARGDVTVAGHLVDSQVRAGGRLRVCGGGDDGGAILSGQALAATGVELRQAGSPTSGAVVGIGPDLSIAAQIKKLSQGIEFCRTNTARILRTLGRNDIDVAYFKRLIDETPPWRRRPVMRLLEQLQQLANTRKQSLTQRQELEKEQQRLLQEARIRISEVAFADVQVRMGEASLTLDEDLRGPIFSWTPGGIHYTEE